MLIPDYSNGVPLPNSEIDNPYSILNMGTCGSFVTFLIIFIFIKVISRSFPD